jgi:hypothetical protein
MQDRYSTMYMFVIYIPHWPLPAVRVLTRDYIVCLLCKCTQAVQCFIPGRCARTGHTLKLQSPTKLARLGHFPPGGPPCRPGVLCICLFSGYLYCRIQEYRRSECEGMYCKSMYLYESTSKDRCQWHSNTANRV